MANVQIVMDIYTNKKPGDIGLDYFSNAVITSVEGLGYSDSNGRQAKRVYASVPEVEYEKNKHFSNAIRI